MMRTSGSGGMEGGIIAIPLVALIMLASVSAGGGDALFSMLDEIVRTTIAAVVNLVEELF